METTRVVIEFMDVLLIDFPSIPLDHKIDFAIDVDPCTKPISINPYHVALVELKELKEQLEDLLKKGFVCLNVQDPFSHLCDCVHK